MSSSSCAPVQSEARGWGLGVGGWGCVALSVCSMPISLSRPTPGTSCMHSSRWLKSRSTDSENTCTMCWCSSRAIVRPSLPRLAEILRATSRSSDNCRARYTCPNAPRPRRRTTSKSSTFAPGKSAIGALSRGARFAVGLSSIVSAESAGSGATGAENWERPPSPTRQVQHRTPKRTRLARHPKDWWAGRIVARPSASAIRRGQHPTDRAPDQTPSTSGVRFFRRPL